MTTYIAFQAFYTDNEITERWARGWKADNAYARRIRYGTLKRLKQ